MFDTMYCKTHKSLIRSDVLPKQELTNAQIKKVGRRSLLPEEEPDRADVKREPTQTAEQLQHSEENVHLLIILLLLMINNSLFDKLCILNLMEKYLLYVFPCSVIIFCIH